MLDARVRQHQQHEQVRRRQSGPEEKIGGEEQAMAPDMPLGPAAPLLYAMAAARPSCFFDVTAGDNRCPFGERWKVSGAMTLPPA